MFAWHLEGLDEEGREAYLAELYGPDTSTSTKAARIERRRALALLHGGEVG